MTALVEIAPPRFDVSLALAYAGEDNITGRPIYRRAACYLHPTPPRSWSAPRTSPPPRA